MPGMSARVRRARWLLPIDRSPIENGWVEIAVDRIVRLGTGRAPLPAEDLGDVALLPGLVNAHTHLELSWLRGRVPSTGSMVEWIRALIAARADGPTGGATDRVEAIRCAIEEMRASGTVLAGDVTEAGFKFRRRHWAHGLHSPYWWLQCAMWDKRETSRMVRAYRKFLEWDILKRPLLTRALEKIADPLMGKSIVLYFDKAPA